MKQFFFASQSWHLFSEKWGRFEFTYLGSSVCVLSVMVLMLITPLVVSAEEGYSTEQQRNEQRNQQRTSRGRENSDDSAFDIQELMSTQAEHDSRRDAIKKSDDQRKDLLNKIQ